MDVVRLHHAVPPLRGRFVTVRQAEVPVEMSLGRRADYAIRATLDLARSPGILRKSREIGEAMAVPVSFLPQILAQLVKTGIAATSFSDLVGLNRTRADIELVAAVESVGAITEPVSPAEPEPLLVIDARQLEPLTRPEEPPKGAWA